jgi:ribose 5-phosphate isomerase B
MPTVYFAADHAGYALKHALIEHVRALGYAVEDVGALTLDKDDDYPDFVKPCAEKVAHDANSFGVIIGGSGQGEAMCANRVKGARAAVFYGPMRVTEALDIDGGRSEDGFDMVRLARRHNNANILSIGARFMTGKEAAEAVRLFLETPFSDSPRHSRRLAKF